MVTRMDHVVILVEDLSRAIQTYQNLGLLAVPGGRHPGFGTENGLVRFGLDYLELLRLRDPAEAAAGRFGGETFVKIAAEGEGLISYALATESLEADINRFRSAGFECSDPFPMRRQRPDGVLLEWRLAFPGGPPWGQPLPFLIHWDTPDEVRLPTAPPVHPLGVAAIARVVVQARDPDRAAEQYARLLDRPAPASGGAQFELGSLTIEVQPAGAGPGSREGLAEVDLAVADLAGSAAWLRERGIPHRRATADGAGRIALAPDVAHGARLFLVERGSIAGSPVQEPAGER